MKGTLKYYEPDSEVNYPGGWAVQDDGDIINKRTYSPCKKSSNWINTNNPPKYATTNRPRWIFTQ